MIVGAVRGNVFEAPQKRVVFAINTEGHNIVGFAGQVAARGWPELRDTGGNKLGEVLRRTIGDKTFYGIVCHSHLENIENPWGEAPRIIREGLDKIEAPEDEEIAVVLMGAGPVGLAQGADVEAILASMESSKKKVIVYTR